MLDSRVVDVRRVYTDDIPCRPILHIPSHAQHDMRHEESMWSP